LWRSSTDEKTDKSVAARMMNLQHAQLIDPTNVNCVETVVVAFLARKSFSKGVIILFVRGYYDDAMRAKVVWI
jgi:hypothetical protein